MVDVHIVNHFVHSGVNIDRIWYPFKNGIRNGLQTSVTINGSYFEIRYHNDFIKFVHSD